MPAIEGIVRPFASQTVSPTSVASSEVQKTGLVVLTIGGSSSGATTVSFSYSHSVRGYMTKQEQEKSGNTDLFASSGAGSNQTGTDQGGQSGAPDFGTVPGTVEEGA